MNKRNVMMRLLAMFCAMLTLLSLAACGKTATNAPEDTTSQSEPVKEEDRKDPEIQAGVGERGDYGDEETPSPEATQPARDQEKPEAVKPEATKPEGRPEDKPESKPEETKPAAPEESQPSSPEETLPPELMGMSYDRYMAMTGEEQEAFARTFEELGDFIAWWNAAKEYDKRDEESVEIKDGVIDLGQLIP